MGRQNDCYQNKHMYFGFLDHLTTMPPRPIFVRTTTWKPCDELKCGGWWLPISNIENLNFPVFDS